MRIERIGALFRCFLYDGAPSAFEGFLEQRWQNFFKRHVLQMVEQNFRHRCVS